MLSTFHCNDFVNSPILFIYIYIYIWRNVRSGKSHKRRKINGKVDKTEITDNRFEPVVSASLYPLDASFIYLLAKFDPPG